MSEHHTPDNNNPKKENMENEDHPQEDERYFSLLRAAYPSPKGNITSSVMSRLRREKQAKRLRRLALSWGSAAACAIIVLLASYTVYYSRDNKLDLGEIEHADEIAAENAVETAAETTPETAYTNAVSRDADFLSGAANSVPECAELPEKNNAASDSLYSASMSDTDSADGLVKVYSPPADCPHSNVFRNSYHDIPKTLVSLIGEDSFNSWAVSARESGGECAVNIVSFYRHFSAVDSSFSEKFLTALAGDVSYYCDYPNSALFAEERFDEIERYYENGGDYSSAAAHYFEYEFKTALISHVGVSSYTSFLAENGRSRVSDWKISELCAAFGITAAELEAIYTETRDKFADEYPEDVVPEYDFEEIAD